MNTLSLISARALLCASTRERERESNLYFIVFHKARLATEVIRAFVFYNAHPL